MSSATGLCEHNNIKSICPRCLRQKKAAAMGLTIPARGLSVVSRMSGMGDCKPGYYALVPGQDWSCVPNSGSLIQTEAAKVAASAAQTDAVKQASINAAGEALGTKIVKFYRESPVIAWGLTAGIGALIFVGAKSFMKKKPA